MQQQKNWVLENPLHQTEEKSWLNNSREFSKAVWKTDSFAWGQRFFKRLHQCKWIVSAEGKLIPTIFNNPALGVCVCKCFSFTISTKNPRQKHFIGEKQHKQAMKQNAQQHQAQASFNLKRGKFIFPFHVMKKFYFPVIEQKLKLILLWREKKKAKKRV